MPEASTIGITVAVHGDDLFPVAMHLSRLPSLALAKPPSRSQRFASAQQVDWLAVHDRLEDYRLRATEICKALGLPLTSPGRPAASQKGESEFGGMLGPTDSWQESIAALERLEEQVGRWRELHVACRRDARILRRHARCLSRLVAQEGAESASRSHDLHLTFALVAPQKFARAEIPDLHRSLVILPLVLTASGLIVAAATRAADRPLLDEFLRSIDHQLLDRPAEAPHDVATLLGDLQQRLEETTAQLRALDREREDMAADQSGRLTRLLARLRVEMAAARLIVRHAAGEKLALFTGEIAAHDVQDLVGGVHGAVRREHVVLLSRPVAAEAGTPPAKVGAGPGRRRGLTIADTGIIPPS